MSSRFWEIRFYFFYFCFSSFFLRNIAISHSFGLAVLFFVAVSYFENVASLLSCAGV